MESQKKQMMKRQFRIGDLAKELKVKKFVIRFWEKEFYLKSDRSQGGQRFYTDEDLDVFLTIKDLLYNQGFTIAGAKKQLPEALSGARRISDDSLTADNFVAAIASDKTTGDDEADDESIAFSEGEIAVDEAKECLDEVVAVTLSLQGEEAQEEKVLEEVPLEEKKCDEVVASQKMLAELVQGSVHEESPANLQAESINAPEEVLASQDNNQKTCIPARMAADSSFYEDLATLKGQLTRLYELLD